MGNGFDIPPHPAAKVFPLLDEDELYELATDIKTNGLQHPVVIAEIDGQMFLVDGRNRFEACRALGIVPDYVLLDGQDPMSYILSVNIHRRHTGTAKIRVHAELGMSMNLLSTRIWA